LIGKKGPEKTGMRLENQLMSRRTTLSFFNKKVENSAQPRALFSDFLKFYYIRDKNLSLDFLIPTFLFKKLSVLQNLVLLLLSQVVNRERKKERISKISRSFSFQTSFLYFFPRIFNCSVFVVQNRIYWQTFYVYTRLHKSIVIQKKNMRPICNNTIVRTYVVIWFSHQVLVY